MTRPENTPTVREEYTSLVMKESTSARTGGTIDQTPVDMRSNPSMQASEVYRASAGAEASGHVRAMIAGRCYRPGTCFKKVAQGYMHGRETQNGPRGIFARGGRPNARC